jgi:uncharacterized membrane protein
VVEKDIQPASRSVAYERLWEMARDPSPIKAEAVNQAQTKPLGVGADIEIVGDLLVAARMACSDLPPDARSALRTILLVITMLCKPGSRIDRDVQDLIEVTSMACAELPHEKGRALRTLLRIASRKLSEVATAARNDSAAVVDLPGSSLRPGYEN